MILYVDPEEDVDETHVEHEDDTRFEQFFNDINKELQGVGEMVMTGDESELKLEDLMPIYEHITQLFVDIKENFDISSLTKFEFSHMDNSTLKSLISRTLKTSYFRRFLMKIGMLR